MKFRFLYIFVLLILTGCLKDNGNYDYTEINEINIEGVSDMTLYDLIAMKDTLKITPILTGSMSGDDMSDMEYEWRMVPIGLSELPADSSAFIVSTERNLRHLITESPGRYYGTYRVTEKSTGNTFSKRFFAQVRALTTEGFAVLCDDNGKTRLDWLFRQSEETAYVLSDIWQAEDYDPIMGAPINVTFGYEFGTGLPLRIVTTEKGSFNLDPIEQKAGEERNIKYQFGDMPYNIRIAKVSQVLSNRSRGVILAISDEGDIYSRASRSAGAVFGYPENRMINETDYFKAAPFVGMAVYKAWLARDYSYIVYDQTNCRFVEYTTAAKYGSEVNWSNNGTYFSSTQNLEMIDMQHVNTKTMAIMRDKTTKETYLYGFSIQVSGLNVQEYYMKLEGEGIEDATVFAFDPLWSTVFYANGSKIYKIIINNNVENQKPAAFSVENNETVVKMFFPKYGAWAKYEDWFNNTVNQLHVAGNNPETGLGAVRIYDYNWGYLIKKHEFTEGFGKIIDFRYFERD